MSDDRPPQAEETDHPDALDLEAVQAETVAVPATHPWTGQL